MDGSLHTYGRSRADDGSGLWELERSHWLNGPDVLRARVDPECQLARPDPWSALREDESGDGSDEWSSAWTEVRLREAELACPRPDVAALLYRARGIRTGSVCEAVCRSMYVRSEDGWRLVQHTRDIVWRASTGA